MHIEQFTDESLSHFSYAVLSDGQIALVDPARNAQPYYDFARVNNAKITAILETHPHADFVSSHLEIHQATHAPVYVSKLLGAQYPHQTFDTGDAISLGHLKLAAINTPGHSPDSISIVVYDEDGKEHAVFTGDTLFIGDCGRPDLREHAGNITRSRDALARDMYHSLRSKLLSLPHHVIIYPAHGAGSLCGKALSSASSGTIGNEKIMNWSLQELTEDEFVKELLAEQPFIPPYFPFDVSINRQGADNLEDTLQKIPFIQAGDIPAENDLLILDSRSAREFKEGHIAGAVNLQASLRFETWLGTLIHPDEYFYVTANDIPSLQVLIKRIAKIGYEQKIKGAFVTKSGSAKSRKLDIADFSHQPGNYTILDLREESEKKQQEIFTDSLAIPLHEIRERWKEIPFNKPVVVHCAGGYRSAVGASLLQKLAGEDKIIFDLGEAITAFSKDGIYQSVSF